MIIYENFNEERVQKELDLLESTKIMEIKIWLAIWITYLNIHYNYNNQFKKVIAPLIFLKIKYHLYER